MKFTVLGEWLAWLEQLHPDSIDLGLDRVREVAERADLLKPSFPIITVGGTNGKGSVCAVLESILQCAGYRVGLYTSPHITDYNERVRIGGTNIDDVALCAAFDAVEKVRGNTSLTYFEFGTLAAVRVFEQSDVDIVIMEVGLGGRLDAVNLWDSDVAIITSLALDHTDWLGETLDDIAFEKSGIARSGRPLIIGEPEPPQRLFERAVDIGAHDVLLGRDFSFQSNSDGRWDFTGSGRVLSNIPSPGIGGSMRYANAAIALQALACMEPSMTVLDEQIKQGVEQSFQPGRAQRLVFDGRECLFDVAHNPQAIQAFADFLLSVPSQGKTLAVAGFMADKAIPEMLRILSKSFDHWYVGNLPVPRAIVATDLAEMLREHVSSGVSTNTTIVESFRQAHADADVSDRIVVFGSFITVAEVLPLTL